MKIGIDISILQTGHRMRGIGYTVINFINHLPDKAKQSHSFVFYMFAPDDNGDPLELLEVADINYEVKVIRAQEKSSFALPGKLKLINNLFNSWRRFRDSKFGDSRITDLKGVDWFFQFNQSQALPSRRKVKSTLVLYDLIQYVMEYDYLPSYKTARLKGHSRKGALRLHLRRHSYLSQLKRVTKSATSLLAISEHTKRDFMHYLQIPGSKISVSLLGVDPLSLTDVPHPEFKAFKQTSWDDIASPVRIEDKPFLLFVGGADPRRKLNELVAAFNNLRAQGHDIRLVLSGDTMLGPNKVPNVELQEYLKHTSYLDDIYFVGFANDTGRDWLYGHALAFVYPSVYEGFGLPILEAMQYGTPVITFDNTSIKEIAGAAAIYADDFYNIVEKISELMSSKKLVDKYSRAGISRANKFNWDETATTMLKSIKKEGHL